MIEIIIANAREYYFANFLIRVKHCFVNKICKFKLKLLNLCNYITFIFFINRYLWCMFYNMKLNQNFCRYVIKIDKSLHQKIKAVEKQLARIWHTFLACIHLTSLFRRIFSSWLLWWDFGKLRFITMCVWIRV